MSIGDLLARMPPHAGAGADVDWNAAESAWGTTFPTDYKAFVTHYGIGSIDAFLGVFEPSVDDSGQPAGYMAGETSVARELWELLGGIPGTAAEPDRILTWATDSAADLLCWLRTDGTPEEWPVLVYSRLDDEWRLYDCGMVEFLLRVLRAEFPENPLSGDSMWGAAAPRFLTDQEEARLTASGQDPWF